MSACAGCFCRRNVSVPFTVAAVFVAASGSYVAGNTFSVMGSHSTEKDGAFPMELAAGCTVIAEREPCRRSDAGFSRISNWRRLVHGCHFKSSWNDSPFVVGSAVFVCWSESQDWNSLSF